MGTTDLDSNLSTLSLHDITVPTKSKPRSPLPSELIDLILSYVEPAHLQSTTLLLLYSLPQTQLSRSALWKHLNITREGQAYQAIVAKRLDLDLSNNSARSLMLTVWRDDPQQIVNLVIPFRQLRRLHMFVGPLFEPEILEELLENPRFKQSIESLSFRFNPYCSERSYYTFLKVSHLYCLQWNRVEGVLTLRLNVGNLL